MGNVAVGDRFAVASPHAAATAAAAGVFGEGGNAVDAALTAAATLAVVFPHMCSVGGDLFALVRGPDGEVMAVNGSGAAPLGIDPGRLRTEGRMPLRGPLTITVPGAVAAWGTLADLGGTRGLAAALGPAVALAEEGVPVSRSLAASLDALAPMLGEDEGLAATFFRGGRPLAEGEILRQPALGCTLRALSVEGPSALYAGNLGEALVGGLAKLGAPLAAADLAAHATEVTHPLTGRYRGWDVLTAPPNSQGFLLLQILGVVEVLGLVPDPLGPDALRLAEVFRLCSRERDRHLADPRRVQVSVDDLLSPAHLREVGRGLRRLPGGPRPGGDTVAVAAADDRGWAVSLIQSVFHSFGAGILEPETGILCHNRGAAFSLNPASPNVLEGGKRPAHTLMPVLVMAEGRPLLVAGTMGGPAQPQIHAHLLLRLLEGAATPGEAVTAPRWVVGGLELGAGAAPEALAVEAGAAERLGIGREEAVILPDHDEGVGHAQVVRLDPSGRLEAASDPRSDGAAAAG